VSEACFLLRRQPDGPRAVLELVREAVAAYLVGEPEPRPGSFADRAADLAGCVDGPADLSTAPEHLAGYGG
jgi:hypothetical protein